MVPFMLLPPCLPSRATQYCYFILFIFFIIFLFYFLSYFYFIILYHLIFLFIFIFIVPFLLLLTCLPSRSTQSCYFRSGALAEKLLVQNKPHFFFSPEKCNKLAKEHNHAHSPKKWFADLGDMPLWAYSLNPPSSKGLNLHVNFWPHP